jgi:MFS family permease
VGGTILIALACLLASRWDAETPLVLVPIDLAVAGLGMALLQAPLASLVTQIVPAGQLGISTGFFNTIRFLGPVLGGALAGIAVDLLTGPTASDTAGRLGGALPLAFLLVAAFGATGALLAPWVPDHRAANVQQPARIPEPEPRPAPAA